MPLPTSSDLDICTKVCGVRGYGEDGSGDIWQNGPKCGVDEVNKEQRVDGLNSPEIGFCSPTNHVSVLPESQSTVTLSKIRMRQVCHDDHHVAYRKSTNCQLLPQIHRKSGMTL